MKKTVALFLILAFAYPVNACVWVKGTTRNATRITVAGHSLTHLRVQLRNSIETDLKIEGAEMEQKLRGAMGFDERNDYSVALMYLGRADEAVKLLKELEAEQPGDYATAANLGTAYELSGQNAEAKRWIEEGIKRNPDSHEGTEWLHAEILKAKIAQERNPDYFKQHSVLNLDYQTLERGAKKILLKEREIEIRALVEALEFQLSERLKFVKGKDAAVASLLFDLSAIKAGTDTLENATALLKMAMEYGYPAERVNPLLDRYAAIIKIAGLRMNLFFAGGTFAAVAFLIIAYKRKWLVLVRSPR